MSDEYVHVAFRSKESGKYLFHVKWPKDEYDRIKGAADLLGMTFEEFVVEALKTAFSKEILDGTTGKP